MRTVVVGGGVGGLAVAIRLAAAGHELLLVERNDTVGGKLATYSRDGYTFDIGPSLITLPHLFDELFDLAGAPTSGQPELVRLDPQFRYHWRDGSTLTVADDDDETAAAFEEFSPGAGAQWRSFDSRGRRIWDVAERTFLAGPMNGPVSLARRLRSPFDVTAIDGFRTLHRSAASSFDDDRLVQWAGRYATYSGSSPFRAPATLACIPHIEARHGCWYPMGGLGTIRDALERLARECGVEIRTGTEVTAIMADADRVRGVALADGTEVAADVVVANVDAEHLYTDLLADPAASRRVRRAGRSTSGFAICAAVRGLTPGLLHHNVWFSNDEREEYEAIGRGELPDDATIYGCVSAVTDPSQAPDGCENWFLLVNTPPGVRIEPDRGTDLVLRRLAMHGVALRERVEFVHTMTPADIAARYGSPGGAIYGTSSDGMRAAFTRPANRGSRAGLYLVGGSSHPGGGLPLVLASARIVSDMIDEDHQRNGDR
jgi:phytoene desaturase